MQAVLRFLVNVENFEQNKKFLEQKRTFHKIFHIIRLFSWWFGWFFRIINVYQHLQPSQFLTTFSKCSLSAGFDLTFRKWFVSFSNENNCTKLMLNTAPHGWVIKNIFHPRLLKQQPPEKDQIYILYQKVFMKKECFKILCKKSFENILI